MKKLISVCLLMSLLLTACGKEKPADTTAAPTEEPTVATTEAPTVPETTAEVTEPEETGPFHPLTGEVVDGPVGRPLCITVNNISDAMPQHGISQADIIHEVETEGGITRLLALFTDLEPVEKLGAIRSARTFFVNIAASYDAVLAHCGGSAYALNANYDVNGNSLSSWKHIDARSDGGFYRDQDRLNSGYAYEHTLFTNGKKLLNSMENHDYTTQLNDGTTFGYQFSKDAKVDGQSAKTVEITFLGSKKTIMNYNESTGLYEAKQYGKDWIDANTGNPIAFKNLLVIQTQQMKPNGYSSFYDLSGSGDGYFALGGSIVPIQWHREDVNSPFSYTFQDGTPITLGVGKTYIAVDSLKGNVSFS